MGEDMNNKSIRLVLMLLAIVLLGTNSFAANVRKVNFSASGNQANLLNNTDYGFELQLQIKDFDTEEISTKAGIFDQISIENYGYSGKIGEPKLPVFSKIIAVPLGAIVSYEIVNRNQLSLSRIDTGLKNRLIPAQPSISKSQDASMVPFELQSTVYNQDKFVGDELFRMEEIGFMRGVRLFRFDYQPINYNPISGELQVCGDAYIKVNFVNPDLAATQNLLDRTGSAEYDALYGKLIYNWRDGDRVNNNRYPTKILILCPPNYVSTMQTYVDWKKQQGYTVIVTTVGTGGTVANTTSAINNYMAGVWSAGTPENPAPTYLLIVGDTSTSGDNIIANTGAAGSHVTDLTYVRLQGSDYLPDMYYGRFSVSSTTELTNIINKTLTFQKTLMPDLSYLGKVVMIAGADASYAPTYGNGQINYGTTHYFNTGNGITSNTYLYPASETSDAAIIANANEGRGYMNYTAHGSETSWADPTFTVSNVNAMTNTSKYGVMVGNCCVTNAFGTGVCFGESIIRKANAGGVVYIGATNNSYWDEDYWWGIGYKTPIQAAAHAYNSSTLGAYDAMFHTHSEAFTNWATTVGEINVMGNTAVEQSTSPRKPYYWEIYSIMGDPSTMPYLGVPSVNTATYPTTILVGATSINVTAAPYSRVALTMGGVTYGTDLVPASGSLTLPITPFSSVGTSTLVITAQNKITRIESITIAPNSGAYMTVDTNTYNDANNNIAEYNETGRFTTTFKNIGSAASNTVTATLTCATAGITITDGTESIAALAAGASVVKTNAFSFTVANNIVNQLSAVFTVAMVSGTDIWVYSFSQLFNAPSLSFGNASINDASGNNNGRLDPDETVTITMPITNNGGATSPSGSATLTSPTSGITINTGSASFAAISATGTNNLSFNITAASSMPVGTVASLVFNAIAGAYTANKTETTTVGLIIENFESGNFSSFPWIQSAVPWTITNSGAYAGNYAAKSGVISHSQSTTMETTRVLTAGGNLSFWYKVSSESGYDYLKFYVDGVLQNSPGWSGTIDWTQATYALTAGTRVLKWEYIKDVNTVAGSDCAWLDNIIFPASTNLYAYYPPQNLTATPGNSFVNLAWQAPAFGTPTGYKIYKNSTLLTTATGLSYTDAAVINGTTYSYYLKAVYSSGESGATSTVTATPSATNFIIIGTGTSSNGVTEASPLNVYYHSLHGQSVYLASELNSVGITGPVSITQIGFNLTGLPTLAMPNFVVRMGHTTSTNVASWIAASGLTMVYSTTSYQPITTGYNMITLSTPFNWNGTSNIVIDTAFGLIGSYTQSGTTQYSTVTSGYRYIRSDTVDETSVYTGGSTSTYRPNVRFGVASTATGPLILANPATLAFGNTTVGNSSGMQLTIQNTGDQTLSGTITTPTGYTVTLATRENTLNISQQVKANRNTLSFSVAAGITKTYSLTFAPTAAISYNGNVVISSNAANSAIVNIAVTGIGVIPPAIVVDAVQLTASLADNEDYSDTFTISNTGGQALDFSIALSAVRNPGQYRNEPGDLTRIEWFSATPSSGTIAAGGNQTITGYFSSTGMADGMYEALLSISSNDPVHSIETVQILMEVTAGNHAPQINLPDSFSFDKNSCLVQNFVSFISDTDADLLTLSVSGNTNVQVDIVGASVSFTATQNWFGSEVLTFTVSDGNLMAHDNLTITVNPTDTPDWQPVIYPNNPATLYAMITIEGIPAQLNDVVAAFVGTECRGMGQIVLIGRDNAYATVVVNLASSGETVGFKIYSYANDTIYPVQESMPMETGASYGSSDPVPLNGTLAVVIAAPIVSITGNSISWAAVQFANNYKVFASSDPYGTYNLLGSTGALYWDINSNADRMFYKVIAEQTNPSKGTK